MRAAAEGAFYRVVAQGGVEVVRGVLGLGFVRVVDLEAPPLQQSVHQLGREALAQDQGLRSTPDRDVAGRVFGGAEDGVGDEVGAVDRGRGDGLDPQLCAVPLAETTTLAPRPANRRAVSRPMPLEAPITTTTCSRNGSRSIFLPT